MRSKGKEIEREEETVEGFFVPFLLTPRRSYLSAASCNVGNHLG